jgi:CubicO group peptidase (beta-lactamase class C family)
MITRRPVRSDTSFPVASNGKPVAAYLAVLLASRGLIHLDQPVMEQAAVDLPASPAHRRITPLHLLTHSSGLGNFLRDRRRRLNFDPGTQFAYSGVGIMVLQGLLERRSGRTLDELARNHLFRPVRMSGTWFGIRPGDVTTIASPHIALSDALAPFSIVVAPLLVAMLVILALVHRIREGRWGMSWALAGTGFAVASVAAFAFLLSRSGSWVLAAWFSMIPAMLGTAVALALLFIQRRETVQARRRLLEGAVALAAAIALIVSARSVPIPLPTAETGPANAASTLRATAPALAAFMIELSRPRTLDPDAVRTMTRVHRTIDGRSAWGLGVGIERHARGVDLWHWGSNPGAKSIMIICPQTGDGVVVLTNGSEGSAAMRNIAERVMGRKGCWRPGCGIG